MKFIAKNSNLHIILRPGQPAQPMLGTPPQPALSVRFQNGQVDIQDESIIEMMMRHSGFNQDFIAVDDQGSDPYAHLRAASEPAHVTTELQFGHPVSRSTSPVSVQPSPELKKMILEQATLIAAKMVEQQLPELVAAAQAAAEKKSEPDTPEKIETEEQLIAVVEEHVADVANKVQKPKQSTKTR